MFASLVIHWFKWHALHVFHIGSVLFSISSPPFILDTECEREWQATVRCHIECHASHGFYIGASFNTCSQCSLSDHSQPGHDLFEFCVSRMNGGDEMENRTLPMWNTCRACHLNQWITRDANMALSQLLWNLDYHQVPSHCEFWL